jgi:hypothetical protein
MYNKEEQRLIVLEMLRKSSQNEVQYTKQQNFERAVSFALDEIKELEQQFNQFVNSVSHLEVFQDAVKEPLTQDMSKMIQNLRYLVEKNYTKEEKEKMPENVLNQVRATQERRVELLKKIARRYLSRSK